MNLSELKIGKSAKILSIETKGDLRRHFLDMGIIPGAKISIVKYAPMGDPIEVKIHGYELTLRLSDAKKITIEKLSKNKIQDDLQIEKNQNLEHPGFGETGKYHDNKDCGKPLPDNQTLRFALVGNQNTGKTSLFNNLTGSNQHVGNFPGVTVDKKEGQIKGFQNTLVTDLPGIYSMSPYSTEEIVSRNYILDQKPNCIINIVDATNIERNLYLTMQLLEMDIPMVVALNMMDEVVKNKGAIYINEIEALLGVPVVPISAFKNQGVDELINHAIHIAKYQEKPIKQDFCRKDNSGGAVHRAHHAVEAIIEDHAERENISTRFAASKVIEGDNLIIKKLNLDKNEIKMIEHAIIQMETESNMKRDVAIADMRFDFIKRICSQSVVKPQESKERLHSEKIDKILTGKWTAIPCFILIISLVFFLTFNVIGAFFQNLLQNSIYHIEQFLDSYMTSVNFNQTMHSLIIDGVFGGVGNILSFLPIVVTLFFFLSLMEDSGYIARIAFVMDKLLRKIGLSGRSIVPMLIGFGCTVPAVMATRTLPSSRDRYMTILLTPFMSCTAKLPIYAFFVSAFFSNHRTLIMVSLYLLGIIIGIIIAFIFKYTVFKGEPVPFVMELPNYRLPSFKNVFLLLWEKAKDFITKAFTIILCATIVIWFLQKFDFSLNLVTDSETSILANLANFISPIFKPLELNNWKIVTSFISGFMAKESIVSTMDLLFNGNVITTLTSVQAITMLVFSLLYTPCIASIVAIKNEMGRKWAFFVVVFQCVIAWICAYFAHFVFSTLLI